MGGRRAAESHASVIKVVVSGVTAGMRSQATRYLETLL